MTVVFRVYRLLDSMLNRLRTIKGLWKYQYIGLNIGNMGKSAELIPIMHVTDSKRAVAK